MGFLNKHSNPTEVVSIEQPIKKNFNVKTKEKTKKDEKNMKNIYSIEYFKNNFNVNSTTPLQFSN